MSEFVLLYEGYQRRQEEAWDRTRHLMADVRNHSGLGTKRPVTPKEIIKLSREKARFTYIRTREEAIELAREICGTARNNN